MPAAEQSFTRHDPSRVIRAPRGTDFTAKSWQTEAPKRMLMNNLDPEVAERPDDDETLLVQSSKPVGVLRTHEWAPRVLIANSNLVGDWADWEHFRHLEAEGAYPLRDTAYSLLCTQSDVERARELSAALIEAGGSEGMPIRKAPWGDYYGQTFDRYGVMWSFSVPAEGPAQAD